MAVQNWSAPQTREESGEDWWFGHCNYYEGGINTGTLGAGYISHPNCYWPGMGCANTLPNATQAFEPRPGELERPNHRKGTTRGQVALMDEEGDDVWVKYLLTGQIFNVIQSSDGGIVVAGVTSNAGWPDQDGMDQHPIRWNDQDLALLDMNNLN